MGAWQVADKNLTTAASVPPFLLGKGVRGLGQGGAPFFPFFPFPIREGVWGRRSRLGVHFRRQQLIAGYIADFYCHRAALVVQLDGSGHQQQPGYDRLRHAAFTKLGIRFPNQEVRNDPGAVMSQIRAALT